MKPEDLKPLFPRQHPAVIYQDRFLSFPRHVKESFVLPSWNEIFVHQQPIYVEYCSGNGHWITEQAQACPHLNWIAVELQFERARKIWAKRENLKLDNLLIVCAEACYFTQHYLPSASIHGVFIHFPDPWPKRRHAKHRLIQPSFLEQVTRVAAPDAEFLFVSDDFSYIEQTLSLLSPMKEWKHCFDAPYFIEQQEYGSSTFALLWQQMGRSFRLTKFKRL
ncbi:MAG: tRNA (guanine(46)-N(7))-methyltransferase TrmB [Verrucomicrobia bacterium]|nr:tRNA (guanine(46)-N(7))-methyltransferase TrmB [Verrucomicrobiota bacterium]MBS0645950.1 tRNA (guanine(46)-N(7))-methyltransferase TrmB [Verrucomicrobiota bacterium]